MEIGTTKSIFYFYNFFFYKMYVRHMLLDELNNNNTIKIHNKFSYVDIYISYNLV